MRQNEVEVGKTYRKMVSGRLAEVRIDEECPTTYRNGRARHGGWNATNLKTNRHIHVRSAASLRPLGQPKKKINLRLQSPEELQKILAFARRRAEENRGEPVASKWEAFARLVEDEIAHRKEA